MVNSNDRSLSVSSFCRVLVKLNRNGPTGVSQKTENPTTEIIEGTNDNVRISNMRGKVKRHGANLGRRSDWKKAYVTLAEGHDIDFIGAE